MPRPSRPWFRFYVEAVYDRKLRRLPPAHRWLWVVVLAAARQSPLPGLLMVSLMQPLEDADLADMAALPTKEIAPAMTAFRRAGMVEMDENIGCWSVTNWSERQFESDDTTERTRKHRRRNVPTSSPGTPPETEAYTDTDKPLLPPNLYSRGAVDNVSEEGNLA